MISKNRWLVRKTKHNPDYRIICIPFAGGSPASFYAWAENIAPTVELAIVHLPGRDSRFNEPLPSSIEEITSAISAELDQLEDKPFVIYGHSLGAAIAYELSLYLQATNRNLPVALIVSGRIAPHLKPDRQDIHQMKYSEFKQKIREYNGTPAEIIDNDEVFSIFETTLRSDFKLSETYRRELTNRQSPLPCPLVAYCGSMDIDAPLAKMAEWKCYSDDFQIRCLNGGHFFIFEHGRSMLRDMENILFSQPSKTTYVSGSDADHGPPG